MSVIFYHFRPAPDGRPLAPASAKIPPALLAGLEFASDAPGEAFTLAIIFPTANDTQAHKQRADAAWLVSDASGRVSGNQVATARALSCSALFGTDPGLKTFATAEVPAFQVLNYPGMPQPVAESASKIFPVGLIGPESMFHPGEVGEGGWSRMQIESISQTFPTLSWRTDARGQFSHAARLLRAQCQLVFVAGEPLEVFRPETLEIAFDGGCIVTTPNVTLQKLGFIHRENCLLVTPADAISECIALLQDPVLLEKISRQAQTLAGEILDTSSRGWLLDWRQATRDGKTFSPDAPPEPPPKPPWWERLF